MNVFWPVSRKKNWLNVAHWPFKWVCFRGTVPMHLSSLNPQSSKWKNTKREFTQLKASLTIGGHTDVREINSPIHIWYAHRNSLSDTITQQTQPFKTHFTIYLPLFSNSINWFARAEVIGCKKCIIIYFFPPVGRTLWLARCGTQCHDWGCGALQRQRMKKSQHILIGEWLQHTFCRTVWALFLSFLFFFFLILMS